MRTMCAALLCGQREDLWLTVVKRPNPLGISLFVCDMKSSYSGPLSIKTMCPRIPEGNGSRFRMSCGMNSTP